MDCEQALALLVAHMDREIQPDDRVRLQTHMQECADCRATADAYRLQDADLRRLFAVRRRAAAVVAERAIAQFRASPVRARRRLPWLPILVSAAAGFLLAVLLFRPWERGPHTVALNHGGSEQNQEVVPGPIPFIAKNPVGTEAVVLAVANKAVEVLSPGQSSWQMLKTGGEIPLGTRVRTPSYVRCEFRMPDGSEIRVNSETELRFAANRQLELTRGQILAVVAQGKSGFQVGIPEATVTALGTEFDILCQRQESVLTVLQGTTKIEGKGDDAIVKKGERARIVKGRVAEKNAVQDALQATSWIEEILMLKGRNNKELAKRVEDILAQIGAAKTDFMNEDEIRRLGDHCVLPLTRFIESERSEADLRKRHMAARILADLAQPWSIPDLIQLLHDQDKTVRYYAARGLKRLTQQTFGREPEQWRDQPWASCERTYLKWQSWWQDNKHRYPGAVETWANEQFSK